MTKDVLGEALLNVIAGDGTTANEASPVENRDFPPGTTLKLDTKKYLWAILGHIGLEVPVQTWDDVNLLVGCWYEFQSLLEKDWSEELNNFYKTAPAQRERKPQAQQASKSSATVRSLRGLIFTRATERGIHAKTAYPGLLDMDEAELRAVLADIEKKPIQTDDAKQVVGRIRRARRG